MTKHLSFCVICERVYTVCGYKLQGTVLCKAVLMWIELNQCISSGAGYWDSVTGVCQAHGGYSGLLHHLSAWDISRGLLQIQISGRYKYTHWFINGRTFEISHTSLFVDECCSSDLCIKVLKKDCSCPGARKLVKW